MPTPNELIEKYGSTRDALNITLAQLAQAKFKLAELQEAIPYNDCPKCGGIIVQGWRCLNCNYDESMTE